jgi:5'-3' exonuclease
VQVVDFKALVGDPSDNVPGVKGVGPKYGLDLLSKYDSLDGVYDNIGRCVLVSACDALMAACAYIAM